MSHSQEKCLRVQNVVCHVESPWGLNQNVVCHNIKPCEAQFHHLPSVNLDKLSNRDDSTVPASLRAVSEKT